MKKFVMFVVVCGLAIQLRAEPELKGSPAELAVYLNGVAKSVLLSGESELKLPADRALISLKVVTENKLLQEASKANQESRAKILRVLVERGVPADRVQPSKFSSTPKYGMFGEKAKSYRVENVVKITAQDEKEFQAVANLVDSMPEVRYDSIEFEHSDKEGLKTKTLAQALDKAAEKKKLFEEKLGVKLTPKSFGEGSVTSGVELNQREYNKIQTSGLRAQSYTGSPAAGAVEENLPTAFGELVFKANVAVEYSVGSK